MIEKDFYLPDTENAFDALYPWAGMRLCCLKEGNVVYENDPAFSRDGSAGDVFVEIPAFWSRKETVNGEERIAVSPEKQEGFTLEPAFTDENGKALDVIYVAAYATGESNRSQSGLAPTVHMTLEEFIDAANEKGFGVYDATVWSALQKLVMIEFGTRDLSQHLNGIGELPYNSDCKATESAENSNIITLATEGSLRAYRAGNLEAGMTVLISDAPSKNAKNAVTRLITDVKTSDDGRLRTISFDGDPITVTAGVTCLAGIGQPSGQTDAIGYHTGMWENNDASAFKYRGIENLWGNVWTHTAGIAVKDLRYYVTTNPALYNRSLEEWGKVSFEAPEQNQYPYKADAGWIRSFGKDENFGWLMLPDAVGANNAIIGDKLYMIANRDADGNAVEAGTEFTCVTGGGWDHCDRNGPFTLRFWIKRGIGESWLYGSRMVIRKSDPVS